MSSHDVRLRKSGDFARVYRDGRSLAAPDVVLVCLPNDSGHARFGVVASRKLGGSVRRNRAKRIVREAHRLIGKDDHLVSADLVLIARVGAVNRSSRDLRKQIRDLYVQAGVIPRETPAHDSLERTSSGGTSNS